MLFLRQGLLGSAHVTFDGSGGMLTTARLDLPYHYENTPMQYTEIFKVVKKENFH